MRFRFGDPGELTAPSADRLTVGDPRVVDFLSRFARRLLAPAVARRHPELGSLGYFLRLGRADPGRGPAGAAGRAGLPAR
nr:hypothetical protein GCM10020092_103030 [Actinoplanes digitatis]